MHYNEWVIRGNGIDKINQRLIFNPPVNFWLFPIYRFHILFCLINVYIPTKTVNVRDRPNERYDADVAEAKKELRKAERNFLVSRTSEDLQEYRRLSQNKCNLVTEKMAFYTRNVLKTVAVIRQSCSR